MSKFRKSNKEAKTKPVLTFKEKRIKKHNKREEESSVPFVFPS